jgi:hypothetical protein
LVIGKYGIWIVAVLRIVRRNSKPGGVDDASSGGFGAVAG